MAGSHRIASGGDAVSMSELFPSGTQNLDDARVLEDAALVLLRRYPGTRPDSLEATIANLQWIARTGGLTL
jgi:hypothetical protein